MKKYKITLIEGDGIGPEVINSAVKCIDYVAKKNNFQIIWDKKQAGIYAYKKFGNVLPEETILSIKKNKVALKGPITTPLGKGFRSVNVELRKKLNLFANVRPSKNIQGISSRYSNINLIVIRENTEDLYSGIEFKKNTEASKKIISVVESLLNKKIQKGSAVSLKTISTIASKKISEFAFSYAIKNNRKKVTTIHKSNILKYTDGLFVNVSENISKKYKSIFWDQMVVDNACAKLVLSPENFDILLCPNLYGDIISDLCSGLVGGIGIAPSANIGKNIAVFEPVHGSAPKHAGKNEVNPTAAILSGVMMLRHIGENKSANEIEKAVLSVIKEGKFVTYDINQKNFSTTTNMCDEIIKKMK
ncbi:MAG: isocitrate/isopropylmalate dehydrogenase family protein [Candidatus Parvarchaeum sp.]